MIQANLSILFVGDRGTDEIMADVGSAEDRVQLFKKDLIIEGLWIHPHEKWQLNATPERMRRWADTFKKMQRNGVDVEVVLDHSHSAAGTVAYLKNLFIDKNDKGRETLFGIIQAKGEKAIDIIKRNRNVSIGLDYHFTDGKGIEYGEAIKHVSISQQPVVSGQQDFVQIAASMNNSEKINVPIFVFSEKGPKPGPEVQAMWDRALGI